MTPGRHPTTALPGAVTQEDPSTTTASPSVEVLHVIEAFGGVETYIRLAIDHWPGAPTMGFVLAADGSFADYLRARGHRVWILPMPRTGSRLGELRAAGRLRRLVCEVDPVVVHLHSSQAGFVGRIALAGSRRQVVYTPHAYFYLGKSGPKRAVFLTAERILERLHGSWVLATSRSEAYRAVHDVHVPRERVRVLMNAVEEVGDVQVRQRAGSPARVGLVGRISAQKDIGTYLRMVADLRAARGRHFVAGLAGVGHYEDDEAQLDRLLADAGLRRDDLELGGWMPREDLLRWLGRQDVIVLTSRFESFGYVLAEAAARGIPTVATDVDGIRDVVSLGRSGFLAPPGDHAALAECVARLLDEPDLYARMSREALQVAGDRLAIVDFVSGLATFYRGLGADVPEPRPLQVGGRLSDLAGPGGGVGVEVA